MIPWIEQEVDCGTPPDVADGTYTLSDGTKQGSVATYSCNTGYKLKRNNQNKQTCTASGDWSGTLPQCVGEFCREGWISYIISIKLMLILLIITGPRHVIWQSHNDLFNCHRSLWKGKVVHRLSIIYIQKYIIECSPYSVCCINYLPHTKGAHGLVLNMFLL